MDAVNLHFSGGGTGPLRTAEPLQYSSGNTPVSLYPLIQESLSLCLLLLRREDHFVNREDRREANSQSHTEI